MPDRIGGKKVVYATCRTGALPTSIALRREEAGISGMQLVKRASIAPNSLPDANAGRRHGHSHAMYDVDPKIRTRWFFTYAA